MSSYCVTKSLCAHCITETFSMAIVYMDDRIFINTRRDFFVCLIVVFIVVNSDPHCRVHVVQLSFFRLQSVYLHKSFNCCLSNQFAAWMWCLIIIWEAIIRNIKHKWVDYVNYNVFFSLWSWHVTSCLYATCFHPKCVLLSY